METLAKVLKLFVIIVPAHTDVSSVCPTAVDEPQKASDVSILGCLASNSSALSSLCRGELAALVRISLRR